MLLTKLGVFTERFHGSHLTVCRYSKQAFIQDVPNPVDLSDGTVSFMDYMGNRNNRFTTPEAAAKNHILDFVLIFGLVMLFEIENMS